MKLLVVEVGGTWLRAGPAQERPLQPSFVAPTPKTVDHLLSTLMQAIRSVNTTDVGHVVIAFAGIVTRFGVVEKSLNTPIANFNLKSFIEAECGIGATVRNDSQVQYLGLPITVGPSALLSWGTGVGGALGVDGRLLCGHQNFAGEFGHALRGHTRERCKCGAVGCLDQAASGRALNEKLGPEWYARTTEPTVVTVLDAAIDALKGATGQIARLYDPRVCYYAGRIFELAAARRAMQQAAREDWSSFRTVFLPNAWRLTSRGALRLAINPPAETLL
jgi:predicted NBD/HSP70 family sugar kinase